MAANADSTIIASTSRFPPSSSSSSATPPRIFQMDYDDIVSILHHLPVESIVSFSMTCKRFRSLATSDSLWESVCRRDWGGGAVDAIVAALSAQERGGLRWKRLYERVSHLSSLYSRRLSNKSGSFPRPRASHSLNLVKGWLVLFGGGCEGGRHLDDTWIAHTGNGFTSLSWQQVNSGIPSGRFGQTCTLLGESVILFGGFNDSGGRLNDTWIGQVNCEGGPLKITISWRLLEVGPVAPPPRGAHAACYIRGRMVVIHGGIGLYGLRLSDTWLLDLSNDLSSGSWYPMRTACPSPPPRSGHTLTCIGETGMILFGGRGSGYEVLNDVWLFDISGGLPEWKELKYELSSVSGEMPLPRVGHSATLVLGGKVLIYGGEDSQRRRKDDFWVLEAAALLRSPLGSKPPKMWRNLRIEGQFPNYRSFHGACADPSGRRIYVFGGMVDGVIHPAEAYGLRFNEELYQVELML